MDKLLKFNNKLIKKGSWVVGKHALGLTIDLNNVGTECTDEFLTQTNYPGVWDGFRCFRLGPPSSTYSTIDCYLRNLDNIKENLTLWYVFCFQPYTAASWGEGYYQSDNSVLISRSAAWFSSGLDSQKPQYDKNRRYRNVVVNKDKGGDIRLSMYYRTDPWYGNSLYFCIPQEFILEVINPKT